jgi:hypothetical protein
LPVCVCLYLCVCVCVCVYVCECERHTHIVCVCTCSCTYTHTVEMRHATDTRVPANQAQVSNLLSLTSQSRSQPRDQHTTRPPHHTIMTGYGHETERDGEREKGRETLSASDAAWDLARVESSITRVAEAESRSATGDLPASHQGRAPSHAPDDRARAHMPATAEVPGAKHRGQKGGVVLQAGGQEGPADTALRRRSKAAEIEWQGGNLKDSATNLKDAATGTVGGNSRAEDAPNNHSGVPVEALGKPLTLRGGGGGGGTRAPTPTKRAAKGCRAGTSKAPAGDSVRRPCTAPRLPLQSRHVQN